MSFTFEPLELPDVIRIRAARHGDARGFFQETYRRSAFAAAGIEALFVQANHARSAKRVLRGLHYQLPPRAQGKLVRVVAGAVYDVAVDIRRDSRSYGAWVGCTLSGDEAEMLWVPPGFAHGYVVLSESADLTYFVTEEYDAALDRGFRWNDPAVGVVWPVDDPVLSAKDRALPVLAEADHPVGP